VIVPEAVLAIARARLLFGWRFRCERDGCTTIAEPDMSPRTFSLVAAVVFGLIALGHVFRIVLGWSLTIQNSSVPMWASALAVVIMGYLAYEGFRSARKSVSGM
jgi:hypothetical protein